MKVPLVSSKFDLSTPEGQQQMLLWLTEADEEVAVFIRCTAERERKALEGLLNGTSPCAKMVIR